jgi:glucosylceramidase
MTKQVLVTDGARRRIVLRVIVASPLAGLVVSTRASAQEVHIYVCSQAGDRITLKPSGQFGPKAETKEIVFAIHGRVADQKTAGFGGSFLEAGMICPKSLPVPEEESVLRALYDPEQGVGFSAMKSPIAGADFMSAGPYYTYDEAPGDVDSEKHPDHCHRYSAH